MWKEIRDIILMLSFAGLNAFVAIYLAGWIIDAGGIWRFLAIPIYVLWLFAFIKAIDKFKVKTCIR